MELKFHRTSDKAPPRDGTMIIGIFKDGRYRLIFKCYFEDGTWGFQDLDGDFLVWDSGEPEPFLWARIDNFTDLEDEPGKSEWQKRMENFKREDYTNAEDAEEFLLKLDKDDEGEEVKEREINNVKEDRHTDLGFDFIGEAKKLMDDNFRYKMEKQREELKQTEQRARAHVEIKAPVGRIINSTIILDDCQTCSVRETKEEIEGMKE